MADEDFDWVQEFRECIADFLCEGTTPFENYPPQEDYGYCTGHSGKTMRFFAIMYRRKVFRASAKFAVRAREYKEVMAEWERRRRAGETMTIFRSEANQLRARLKMTDELWSQIQTLYEQSDNVGKKTRATKRDDRLFGRGVVLLERLSDLQRANIRQFRTFLTRPANESKDVK